MIPCYPEIVVSDRATPLATPISCYAARSSLRPPLLEACICRVGSHATIRPCGKEDYKSKANLTSKGQLTVPKEVQDRLGLKPGDGLIFEFDGDAVRLRVEKRRTLRELKGSLPVERAYPGREAERDAARAHVVRERSGEEPAGR